MRSHKKNGYGSLPETVVDKRAQERKLLIEAIRKKIERLDGLILDHEKKHEKYSRSTHIPSEWFFDKIRHEHGQHTAIVTGQLLSRTKEKRSLLCLALHVLHETRQPEELLQQFPATTKQVHTETSPSLFSKTSTTGSLVNQVLVFFNQSIQTIQNQNENSALTPLLL